ncbi:MAG: chorismate synthase [Candidatus Bathyarchaeia archaeon]
MPANSIGERFTLTLLGESHGACVGAIVDGCPPGLPLQPEDIQKELDKRRPSLEEASTRRREEDHVEILSGVFRGYTTGAPICMLVWNRDVQSEFYEELKRRPRPGHADYPAYVRYGGFNDYRGGGRFSARVTIGFVMAGAIAKKLLKTIGVEVLAHTVEIGGVALTHPPSLDEIRSKVYTNTVRCANVEASKLMEEAIRGARAEGDSVGGIVECMALNLPAGLGDPIFASLDADLAKFLFCIPAVKGLEFGAGFKAARLRGSDNNDEYAVREGRVVTLTNNSGGILGGLSTGMPLVVRVAFKPPSSIPKRQRTVDLETMTDTTIEVKGRHDACVVPRAVPIVEAVVATVLVDHILRQGFIKTVVSL